ncbi:hypothetical protein IKI14_02715 [bacterium]|nr:hypothetical protein [bacterium]
MTFFAFVNIISVWIKIYYIYFVKMAIKDPNVLNRINTLNTNLENTNLENANITEIQNNISHRLFGVLD